jgi:starch phosphorylase
VEIRWPGDAARIARLSIIEEGPQPQVRMAHLATVGTFSVNGVARLHTELIQSQLMPDFYELWPDKFNNKTNGVTPRRWMLRANPDLSALITRRIGRGWIDEDFGQIKRLREFADDDAMLTELRNIKQSNKERLAMLIGERAGTYVSPNAMYIVHVKRFHEYKRQLLCVLSVIASYLELRDDPSLDLHPRTYVFAGKAAAGYAMAKLHIKLIHDIAEIINRDPAVARRLKVVFQPNYSVSLAEAIMPAADLTLQTSLTGTEASGTGNL